MDTRGGLTEFLRTRRARVRPEDLGLRMPGQRRRVPGLRREELAQLAGISVDYYVRLEQGRTRNVSDQVLDAVARVLRLDGDERRHLFNLAQPASSARRRAPARPERVRPGAARLLEMAGAVPAYIVGRRCDVLAWNPLACALFTDFGRLPAAERNWGRLIFLREDIQALFADWTVKARETVSYLRLRAGAHPDDAELAALVGELSVKSEDFRRWWADHDVKEKTHGRKHLLHPLVGELTLDFETARLPDAPDQVLVFYTAEAGSPSEHALRLLTQLGERERERADAPL
ncbi:helix-turn-helix transcriptional regulator [Pseudonocardia acaciae]|uniref:helix-turn-helix transcriptional regulator n=1 Tax=Pseudonocardia acaciae TaxID=551276 RepID=UPI000687BB49|nr:helix-turn-helix transcriptional regulator [Pseudonocardia acaciae]